MLLRVRRVCSSQPNDHPALGAAAQAANHEGLSRLANAAGSAGTSPSRMWAWSSSRAAMSATSASRLSPSAPASALHEIVAHVELEDRLGAAAAILARQQALQLAVAALRAGDQAGGAVGQALRGAHVGDLLAKRVLDGLDDGRVLVGRRLLLGRLVEQRHQREIDVALAQRLERLAVEVLRHHRPEGVDRIGQQQHLDAARAGGLELGIGFHPLRALADEIVDLGLVGLEVGDVLLERAQAARPPSWRSGRAPAAGRGVRGPRTGLP